MIHKNRIFQVKEVTDIAALSETLTQHTWTLCTAFKLAPAPGAEPLLFLNDSFSEKLSFRNSRGSASGAGTSLNAVQSVQVCCVRVSERDAMSVTSSTI